MMKTGTLLVPLGLVLWLSGAPRAAAFAPN